MASMGSFGGNGRPSGDVRATEWNVHLVVAQLTEDIAAALANDVPSGDVLEGVTARLENLRADLTGEVRPVLGPVGYLPEGYARGAR